MRKQQKAILMLATIAVFVTMAGFLPGLVHAGNLEPSAPPGLSMHTMDEIYKKVNLQGYPYAPVAKTGQTASYAAGDDGDLQKGVAWPDPRFTEHINGTVTDNLTGLMWTKDANMHGTTRTWTNALSDCASCTEGGYNDWRLPNVRELHSLIDYSRYYPALPGGHPFTIVQGMYWSSTTRADDTRRAWTVFLDYGHVSYTSKGFPHCVCCVRGGR